MNLFYVTGNKGKFEEAKRMLPELEQLEIDLPEIQEIEAQKIIEKKLLTAYEHKKAKLIVDDASLYLDCLKGLPGPLIKWFLKTIGNEGLVEISKKLGNDKAWAKALIGYIDQNSEIMFFEGKVEGKIVEPRGCYGFGWDAIFLPDGHNKTYAEMTTEEKNQISHRKLAMDNLIVYLKGLK